jgi:hypothetical protein
MSHEHSHIQRLKHRWGQEDAERDELEEQARRKFLEQEANQIFSPIENYLTKLAEVLRTAGASVEVDARWEHLGDQRLLRIQVSSGEPAWRQRRQLLSLAVARNISLRGFNCHQRPLHLSVERQSQRALPRLAKPQPRRWNRSRAKPTNQQSALSLLPWRVRW